MARRNHVRDAGRVCGLVAVAVALGGTVALLAAERAARAVCVALRAIWGRLG